MQQVRKKEHFTAQVWDLSIQNTLNKKNNSYEKKNKQHKTYPWKVSNKIKSTFKKALQASDKAKST